MLSNTIVAHARQVFTAQRLLSADHSLHTIYFILVTLEGNPYLSCVGALLACYTAAGLVREVWVAHTKLEAAK